MENPMQPHPQVIVIREDKPNHLLHLILSIVTGGLWLPIWFLIAMKHNLKKRTTAARAVGNSFMAGVRAGRG